MNKLKAGERQKIAEIAAGWFVRLRDDNASRQDREKFVEWLRDSPVHVYEYLAVVQVYGDLEHAAPDKNLNMQRQGLTKDDYANVVSLNGVVSPDNAPNSKIKKLEIRIATGIAAAALVILGLVWLGITAPSNHFKTSIGEQRSIALIDDSIVELNTNSELIVEFTDNTRQVRLLRGEAYFDVTRNPDRPFTVVTGNTRIKVLGTQFNVYLKDAGTTVTVLKGEVSVARIPAKSSQPLESQAVKEVMLDVGEQARIMADANSIETVTTNINKIVAWQERRLEFEGHRLVDILEEFNRYNINHVEVHDASLANLELSGIFKSNDLDSLIEFLKLKFDVRIIERSDRSRIIVPKELTSLQSN